MAKKPYDEVSVLRILSKKKSCSIEGKNISVLNNADDLGNSAWGKIDFLVKYKGYNLSRVNNFKKVVKEYIPKEAFDKRQQRNNGNNKKKLNIASMSKDAMRKASINKK